MAGLQLNGRSSRGEEAPPFSDFGVNLVTSAATKVWVVALALLLLSVFTSFAQAPIRFATVDVFVNSGTKSLAAYQLEFKAAGGNVKIAGIEGGEHAAFKEPAFYDPKAMQQERVILAAFSTSKNLPKGRTRVATIHVQVTGEAKPDWAVKLVTAADAGGKRIAATVEVKERIKP
jgi:hypothetical protein